MTSLSPVAFACILLLSASAFAAPDVPYQVEVGGDRNNIRIGFLTKASYSAMCHRDTVALRLGEPQGPEVGIPSPPIGLIAFKTELKPDTICLTAEGPHNGSLFLARGSELPAIGLGYYALKIDGRNYGYVWVTQDGAELLDKNQLPQ